MRNRHLFGGALFTAGLAVATVTQPVSADFKFSDGLINYGFAYGLGADGGSIFENPSAFGPEYFDPLNYNGDGGLVITAWANPTSMGFTHGRDPADQNWAYSGGRVFAFFEVTENTTVQLDWDFGAWGFEPFIRVTDFFGNNDFFEDEDNPVGSATFNVVANTLYFFAAGTAAFAGGGDSFGTMTIVPAPAAAPPLLAAGGLLVSRRRRRE